MTGGITARVGLELSSITLLPYVHDKVTTLCDVLHVCVVCEVWVCLVYCFIRRSGDPLPYIGQNVSHSDDLYTHLPTKHEVFTLSTSEMLCREQGDNMLLLSCCPSVAEGNMRNFPPSLKPGLHSDTPPPVGSCSLPKL